MAVRMHGNRFPKAPADGNAQSLLVDLFLHSVGPLFVFESDHQSYSVSSDFARLECIHDFVVLLMRPTRRLQNCRVWDIT